MTDGQYQVKVTRGEAKGSKFGVKTEALVLGSSEDADIVLQGREVEPHHAQIIFEGGQVKLEDLGTQSGTFRNGKRLLGPVRVFPGDRIGLGPEVVLILEGDDPKQGAGESSLSNTVGKVIDDLAGDLGMGKEEAGET